jgi:glycosyltransferase involved in cell wall biosynthesis
MFFGRPIIAFDVVYNRETTENRALYFKTSDDICRLLDCEVDGLVLKELADKRYKWKDIAKAYEGLY